MSVSPIETYYRGCRFRSRLEARWAVFFDALSIRWEYEPQGYAFSMPSGEHFNYLPDFHLPELHVWAEVKGSDTALDQRLLEAAVFTGAIPELLILGPIPSDNQCEWAWLSLQGQDFDGERYCFGHWRGFVGNKNPGDLRYLVDTSTAPPNEYPEGSWITAVVDTVVDATCRAAYTAARSARFEHGETGVTR